MKYLRELPRILLGLLLIATGIGKILDLAGFVEVLATYDLLPMFGNIIVGYALPFIELAVGLGLITKIKIREAALSSVLLHTLFLTIAGVTLWRGLKISNCGCFGVFLTRPLTPWTLLEDAVLLAISFLVLRLNYSSVRTPMTLTNI